MTFLVVSVVFAVLGLGFCAEDETSARLSQTFSCSPANHIRITWKRRVPSFVCRLGDENFLLASTDLEKYANARFDIKVTSPGPIRNIDQFNAPMDVLVDKVVPTRTKRQFGFGGGFSGSSSQSSAGSFGGGWGGHHGHHGHHGHGHGHHGFGGGGGGFGGGFSESASASFGGGFYG